MGGEFRPCLLRHQANLGNGARRDPAAATSAFEAANGDDGETCALGEVGLAEAQQSPGGADLFRRDHHERKIKSRTPKFDSHGFATE